ncbi:ankyrin [Xylariaceae sp. FL1019]|nr:ankyrin [Xylariaceae sp. FL1019]
MHLLDLPLELLDQIFSEAVEDRTFKRVMRLRLVNKHFRCLTDEAIFSSHMLDEIAFGQDFRANKAEHHHDPWSLYLQTYLGRRIYQERNAKTVRGQYRRVAEYLWIAGSKVFPGLTFDDCVYDLSGVACFINSSLETSSLVNSKSQKDAFSQPELATLFLNAVIYMGLEPFAKALLSDDPNDYWQYPTVAASAKPSMRRLIEIAAFKGHLTLLQHLVYVDKKMLNDTSSPMSASVASSILRYASIGRHVDVMEYALDNSDLLNAHLTTAISQNIETALGFTHSPKVYSRLASILEHGMNPFDETMHRALLARIDEAARQTNTDMVRYHLRQGVDLNATEVEMKNELEIQQKQVETPPRPLIGAIEGGSFDSLEELLWHGADPNLYPSTQTPLMAAAHKGDLQMVRTLVEYGANVTVGTPPPLVVAVQQENEDVFHFLESKGALLDPQTGAWAMAYATAYGLDSMVNLLCKHGVKRGDVVHHIISQEEHQNGRYLFKDNQYGVGASEFCLPD